MDPIGGPTRSKIYVSSWEPIGPSIILTKRKLSPIYDLLASSLSEIKVIILFQPEEVSGKVHKPIQRIHRSYRIQMTHLEQEGLRWGPEHSLPCR